MKFLPAEFFPYAVRWCGNHNPENQEHIDQWNKAYRHHYQRMDHHWEYHVEGFEAAMPEGWLGLFCLDPFVEEIQSKAQMMPREAALEVVVDWLAAALSYKWPPTLPDANWSWYQKETSSIKL